LRFGVLGPLLVHDGDSDIVVPAARQRVLLAALLVRAGRLVPADELSELVWDGLPPAGSRVTLRTYVMRLRQALGPRAGSRVVTRNPGYFLDASAEEVDVLRFTRLCQDGSAAMQGGSWSQASSVLGEALGLWRGAALVDVPSRTLRQAELPYLEEMRLQAVEWRIDARLQLCRHAELVPEVQALVAEHPLRERFHAQFMLALYRCGRQADALAAYRYARKMLVDEVGAEPGAELRALHERILALDPALAAPQPVSRAVASPVPRQMPAVAGHFAGRADELAALTTLLCPPGQTTGTVLISAIDGTAGVGKTALAVHWAHQVADRFPDGQLYVNLHGYDPGEPTPPAQALAAFLRALGVSGSEIPADEEERAARYRSLVADRRLLVVLDNARDTGQVRPLLPGSPACAVVVTSRDSLAGLVALDGARRVDLGLLPLPDAVSLLRELIGGPRVDAEAEAVAALAELCCRLPLALRIAAELAAAQPTVPLARLTGELADKQQRLGLLETGDDPHGALQTVFSWSYRRLDRETARAFRLASLHPGEDFDAYAIAALTGTAVENAQRALRLLAQANLVFPGWPGRFNMHDLLRGFALDSANTTDSADQRQAALARLFDHYLHTAASAMDVLFPAERDYRGPRIAPGATPSPRLDSEHAARSWLDDERANLVAAIVYMTGHGWPGQAMHLAVILFRYLDVGGHFAEAVIIHGYARQAASAAGDKRAEANALNNLGSVGFRRGRHCEAAAYYREALGLFCVLGDEEGQARALDNLGLTDIELGHYAEAEAHFHEALVFYQTGSHRTGEARALAMLGLVDAKCGRYERATERVSQALSAFVDVGNPLGEATCLMQLAVIELRQDHPAQATGHLQQALSRYRTINDRNGEADALHLLAEAQGRQGQYEQAFALAQQGLVLHQENGSDSGQARALNVLGELLLATRQPGQARTEHVAALAFATQAGDSEEQARAHSGLGASYRAMEDLSQARHHWEQALSIYTQLGAPRAEYIRQQLDAQT
jgi:DNA-binding SARP family transcriptional activator/Tfp pilus assembly protein PilF